MLFNNSVEAVKDIGVTIQNTGESFIGLSVRVVCVKRNITVGIVVKRIPLPGIIHPTSSIIDLLILPFK